VILGQTSIFLLFGFTLFLRFHKTRPFAAGAALWFCTIKPHLFLPFALVLLVWIFVARAWRILAGAAAAFAAGALITTWIDPAAWGQYAYYMRTSVVTREFTPCLGDLLRDSIILPGSGSLLCRRSSAASGLWHISGHAAMPGIGSNRAACLCSFRCWSRPSAGSSISRWPLPAVLWGVSRTSSQLLLSALALIYILVEIQSNRFELHSVTYLLTALAWLIWYLLARANSRKAAARVPAVSV
jgi:hypothetical protein